jgi:hypothetical protein
MSVSGAGIANPEVRAWRSVFQDGLWDIALGIMFLGVGLSMTLGLDPGWTYAEYAAAMVLSVAVIRVGKRRITIPRLGWVKFGPKAERRRLNAFLVPTIGMAVTLVLVPLMGIMRPRPGWIPLVPALVVGVAAWTVLSFVAATWGFPRLYLHAFILGHRLRHRNLAPGPVPEALSETVPGGRKCQLLNPRAVSRPRPCSAAPTGH